MTNTLNEIEKQKMITLDLEAQASSLRKILQKKMENYQNLQVSVNKLRLLCSKSNYLERIVQQYSDKCTEMNRCVNSIDQQCQTLTTSLKDLNKGSQTTAKVLKTFELLSVFFQSTDETLKKEYNEQERISLKRDRVSQNSFQEIKTHSAQEIQHYEEQMVKEKQKYIEQIQKIEKKTKKQKKELKRQIEENRKSNEEQQMFLENIILQMQHQKEILNRGFAKKKRQLKKEKKKLEQISVNKVGQIIKNYQNNIKEVTNKTNQIKEEERIKTLKILQDRKNEKALNQNVKKLLKKQINETKKIYQSIVNNYNNLKNNKKEINTNINKTQNALKQTEIQHKTLAKRIENSNKFEKKALQFERDLISTRRLLFTSSSLNADKKKKIISRINDRNGKIKKCWLMFLDKEDKIANSELQNSLQLKSNLNKSKSKNSNDGNKNGNKNGSDNANGNDDNQKSNPKSKFRQQNKLEFQKTKNNEDFLIQTLEGHVLSGSNDKLKSREFLEIDPLKLHIPIRDFNEDEFNMEDEFGNEKETQDNKSQSSRAKVLLTEAQNLSIIIILPIDLNQFYFDTCKQLILNFFERIENLELINQIQIFTSNGIFENVEENGNNQSSVNKIIANEKMENNINFENGIFKKIDDINLIKNWFEKLRNSNQKKENYNFPYFGIDNFLNNNQHLTNSPNSGMVILHFVDPNTINNQIISQNNNSMNKINSIFFNWSQKTNIKYIAIVENKKKNQLIIEQLNELWNLTTNDKDKEKEKEKEKENVSKNKNGDGKSGENGEEGKEKEKGKESVGEKEKEMGGEKEKGVGDEKKSRKIIVSENKKEKIIFTIDELPASDKQKKWLFNIIIKENQKMKKANLHISPLIKFPRIGLHKIWETEREATLFCVKKRKDDLVRLFNLISSGQEDKILDREEMVDFKIKIKITKKPFRIKNKIKYHFVKFSGLRNQNKTKGQYVTKFLKDQTLNDADKLLKIIYSQFYIQAFAKEFNNRMMKGNSNNDESNENNKNENNKDDNIFKIDFHPCHLLCIYDSNRKKIQYSLIEPYYLNHNPEKYQQTEKSKIVHAFKHFVFQLTGKRILITGLKLRSNKFSRPTIHSNNKAFETIYNKDDGIAELTNFNSRHICNEYCKQMNLSTLKRI
ncbi:alpha-protein kinase vwka [Anaeramoeba flamelloides]|uniref:Alpha-protein kinase vwka n=1 Tax=Anaeramoeba flamelloides TaxID=1746091 RepID=A0ABQ8XY06_9EUKA|nr:alpha-protein kinase vwka [Anaeramoeba flamelloides]